MNVSQYNKPAACERYKDAFLSIDIYRRPFLLLFPDQRNYHRTLIGSVFSVITIMAILGYALLRIEDLLSEYKILDQVQENYFDHNDTFTTNDGFSIAAGIVQIDTEATGPSIEDPEIGTLKMYRKTWDFISEEEYKGNVEWEEIETHFCQDKDFNDVEGNN